MKTKKLTKSVPRWPKGLTPFPFQLEAYRYAKLRHSAHRAVYLALDPGLGKTIVSCLLANGDRLPPEAIRGLKRRKILYVCPPSLTANVQAEFEKWGLSYLRIKIVADSELVEMAPSKADIVFVDEAQRFKNEKAQRSKALYVVLDTVPRVVFLSGTPMPNSRPVELWPILKRYAPDVFGTDFFSFARKYCGARKTHFGWKFDGFTNKAEFKSRLFRSFMLRQKASVVELPELREGLLTVGDGISPILGNLETKVLRSYTKEDLVEGRLTKRANKPALHLSEYLKLLGAEKLKYFYPFLDHLLYDTKERILLFANHKVVVAGLEQYLANFKPIVITGATPTKARHALVKKFQQGKTRVAILNIVAGGIGHNMTKADRVVMVEHSWRDGDNEQCFKRAHRIGRKKPVLVQYVVLKDSFDAKRMEIVLRKRHNAV